VKFHSGRRPHASLDRGQTVRWRQVRVLRHHRERRLPPAQLAEWRRIMLALIESLHARVSLTPSFMKAPGPVSAASEGDRLRRQLDGLKGNHA
jgi:hypothetical protein